MAYLKLSQKPMVFVDTETTGLDPVVNEILEFAAVKGNETLCMKIKPRRIHTAHPKALEVNGYNEAEWGKDAVDISVAAPKIAAFLRDSVFTAHNAKFDVDFINAFLKEAGINERIDYHVVDTAGLSYFLLVRKGAESVSLAPVCSLIGIPPEPSMHRALAGAMTCKAVYEKMGKMTFGG